MKNLMMTTAIVFATATTASAESHITAFSAGQYEASDLIGMRLYAGDATGENAGWDDIGEINDLMISVDGDGQINSAIVGVGGFIGIGEKEVALGLDRISRVKDSNGDMFLVVDATQEELEAMPEYIPASERDDMAMAETDAPSDAMADGTATEQTGAIMPEQDPRFVPPMIERDGYAAAMVTELTAEDLDGARVYGVNDEDVGEIKSLVVSADGKIESARLDVGGFLGMGEKQIEVSFDELTVLRGDDVRVYIDATQEQLESRPQYNE